MILLKFNDSDVKNAFESVVNGLPESKYDATFKENTIALIENQYQSYYTPFMYVQGESDSKQSAITAFKLTLTPFFMRYINIGIQETYFNGLTYGNEAKETQEQIINEGTKTSDNPVNSIYQNLTNRVDRNGNNKNTLTRPDGRTPFGALEEDRGVLSPLFEMVNAFSMLLVSPDDECYCDELCDTFGFEIEKLYAQMNNLQTEVSAISDDVNKNTGDISTLKNDVSQNTSDISNLSTRVTSAEDNITAHTSQINQIDETLNNKLDKTGGTINGNLRVIGNINADRYLSDGIEVIDVDFSNIRVNVGNAAYGINMVSSNRPTVTIGESTQNIAFKNDIPKYTSVDSVIYDTTNGAIIVYNGANEIHIPLLAGENVTIGASEDNKKIVISAAGGGGTGDVTAAGNNTFTGVNTFNNSIYAKNGVVVGDTTNYGANSIRKGPNTYSFPNKSGTFAMTTDVIKNPIYFISFYANDPSAPCHLIGTMMSKNSYGTGQKTNEEFAVMLADNLYTNSNEGLAAYGKLAKKDILCIYSEDGLSIRCLDEENSDVELPTLSFFIMETEL